MYLHAVLTVIAAALVYLCVLFTPLPIASAQGRPIVGAPTPGESTGPAEMVIVGFRLPPDTVLPIQGTVDATVSNTVRIAGRVETLPVDNTTTRAILVGWEEGGAPGSRGGFKAFNPLANQALPVSPR